MRRILIPAVAAIALMTSACDKKATGQTVAVVNGEEITSAELNETLQRANIPQAADREAVTARVLEGLIDRKLLVQQAREEGIDKSPDFISAQRRATEDLLIGMLSQRKTRTAEVPKQNELDSFMAQHPERFAKREIWNLNQVIYKTPEGDGVAAQIKSTKTLDQLASVLSANKIAFERKNAQLNTASLPNEIYSQINKLPAGEPFLVPAGEMTVASAIVARNASPLVGEEANKIAAQQFRQSEGTTKMTDQVKSLRAKAKIEYKEGFGPKGKNAPATKAPAKAN